jgi:ATP-dependent DNA helicase DinG
MRLGNKVQSPGEIGLPAKFDKWRSTQEAALDVMITSPKRFSADCLPTGSGKSALNVAVALLSGEPTCIVTASRGLQTQYMDDFAEIGMVDIRGRANYKCQCKPEDPSYTCEDGYAASCMYKGTVACPSSKAEMKAATSKLVVTNYAKWTAAKRTGQGMEHFTQLILDEAHNAPRAIADAMQVILNYKEIEDGLQLDFPSKADAAEMGHWKEWALNARPFAEVAMMTAQARITGVHDPKAAWVKHFTHMRNLTRRLAILATCRAGDWIVEELPEGYQFDPVRPGRYGESALFMRMPRILMVSATIRPKTMYMCGVGNDLFEFQEFDSEFDRKRCPIYYVPTMRVDSRAGDLGLLWAKLDSLIAKRRDRKGIVHTVSFARQKEILERSRFQSSMVVNSRGEPAAETVEWFKQSPAGTILVTPSVGEGYDFPGDTCRWQFMTKIPFEPPSKIVKAREEDDKEYRGYQAMQGLVQAFGRGMRSKEDACEGIIADQHLDWFLPKFAHLAPRNFHAFFRRIDYLPKPLEIL